MRRSKWKKVCCFLINRNCKYFTSNSDAHAHTKLIINNNMCILMDWKEIAFVEWQLCRKTGYLVNAHKILWQGELQGFQETNLSSVCGRLQVRYMLKVPRWVIHSNQASREKLPPEQSPTDGNKILADFGMAWKCGYEDGRAEHS